MEEVAKHVTNDDCWVVVAGDVLNVTSFLKEHPGGELAIMTFAGKDATHEFNMIHPPDVIGTAPLLGRSKRDDVRRRAEVESG
jgi:cytochrome b involved in lipid metabolism